MCDAFRDLGGRTFRCTIPGAHTGQHRGASGQLVNYWNDFAAGAMGRKHPRSVEPLVTTVAPDYNTQPYEGHPGDALTTAPRTMIPHVGNAKTPFGEWPQQQLAVPNDNDPAENSDAGAEQATVPKVQKPYVEPVSHDDI